MLNLILNLFLNFLQHARFVAKWSRIFPIVSAPESLYWRKRAALQRSAFGRSTAGNDVVATTFIRLFFFFPVFIFLRRDLFS